MTTSLRMGLGRGSPGLILDVRVTPAGSTTVATNPMSVSSARRGFAWQGAVERAMAAASVSSRSAEDVAPSSDLPVLDVASSEERIVLGVVLGVLVGARHAHGAQPFIGPVEERASHE